MGGESRLALTGKGGRVNLCWRWRCARNRSGLCERADFKGAQALSSFVLIMKSLLIHFIFPPLGVLLMKNGPLFPSTVSHTVVFPFHCCVQDSNPLLIFSTSFYLLTPHLRPFSIQSFPAFHWKALASSPALSKHVLRKCSSKQISFFH